ncbi:helix-turn-helix domain-containing protein [Flavobacterium sp.]|jgi:transcriptional regulator with XRE-family HTH domain|uniref:helix-turn-helix domain-containing protein n=1 Tax=Flavobacterium sp. TaxID=239 RepID=UPI003783600D
MKIGENIKKFRELKNLTREQMASELGLSLSGYSKIERDEVDLTISRVQQIAEVLQVELSQILNFDATQIFNISNNQMVQGFGTKVENHNHSDDYREKYIKLLEIENESLKNQLKNLPKNN